MNKRNSHLSDNGLLNLKKIQNFDGIQDFDCGDSDLNDYFRVDAELHKKELLTQTYKLLFNDFESEIIGLVDLSNDSVDKRKFPSGVKPAFMEFKIIQLIQRLK